MRKMILLSVAIVLAATVIMLVSSTAFVDKLESGLPVGSEVTAFGTEKCGGIADGVPVGTKLSYR